MHPDGIARFGSFEFDRYTGHLTKHGHRIKLQPKSAAILRCFLDRPGEVVSRDQIREILWPDGTHVDFDLGIKAAVKKLRQALGDDAAEPKFVQTVYGEGYRFIASLEVETTQIVPETQLISDTPPPPTGGNRWRAWAVLAVVLTIVFAVFLWKGIRHGGTSFQKRDWVVIATFENRTREELLDGSMEAALERELSRSAYVNVAPPGRIGDTLALMRKTADVVLTEALAREVALRDGAVKAVIAGRIEKIGPKYQLSVRLVEPADGATIATFRAGGTQEQLAGGVGGIADGIRRVLGESSNTVTPSNALEKATTPSLRGLRAFSAAMRKINERNWAAAVELLEQAVSQDPRFASAHIYAAHCYSNLAQHERAAPHYEAAYRLAPEVTERERLFIVASYYSRFLHDDRRAMPVYEALVSLYPDDYWGVQNLLMVYTRMGLLRQDMELRERLYAVRPNDRMMPGLLAGLWWWHKRTLPEKARVYRDTILRRRDELSPLQADLFASTLGLEPAVDRWWAGDVAGAAHEVARYSSMAKPRNDGGYLVTANLAVGAIRSAESVCAHFEDDRVRMECLLRVAYVRGDVALGRKLLHGLGDGAPVHPAVDPWLAAWFGDLGVARKWAYPDVEPLILLNEGRVQSAIDQLQQTHHELTQAGASDLFLWPRLTLATALQRQGRLDEAIRELEDETRPSLVVPYAALAWPACRLKLLELLRAAGRLDAAERVESEMLTYLAAADSDDPALLRLRALRNASVGAGRANQTMPSETRSATAGGQR